VATPDGGRAVSGGPPGVRLSPAAPGLGRRASRLGGRAGHHGPEHHEQDFANAKSHLTGDFLNYYSQFTHDSAVVLVFLNQTTTSRENPNGSFTASSVNVVRTKVDGSWLISAFDPV